MNKLSFFIPISLLAAAGFSFAQSSPSDHPPEQGHNAAPSIREAVTESSGGSVGAGSRASGAPATTEENKAPGPASTSDRETSRTWSGIGSTGGGTGTGTSSGTTDEPATSGGGQGGTSASGGNPAPDSTVNTGQSQPADGSKETGGSSR